MWKFYVEQRKFEEAVYFCEQTGSESLRRVKGLYADDLFSKSEYQRAAIEYCDSDRSFEEVALKFLNAN
jgi:hypothetical protein